MILLCIALDDEAKGFELKPREHVLVTGVGKVNAAMKLTEQIFNLNSIWRENLKVVNLGTCGGQVPVAGDGVYPPGTIVNPTSFADSSDLPLKIRLSHYRAIHPHNRVDPACITNDSFGDAARYQVRDMEAYALAKVCKHFDIPFHCHKIVTDSGRVKDWEKMLPICMKKLWTHYYDVVYPALIKEQ